MKRRVDAKRLLLCLASGCGIGVVYALAFRGRYQTAYVLLIDALHTGGTCLLLLGLLRAALNLGLFDSVAYGFRRMHAVNRRARGEEMPEEQAEIVWGPIMLIVPAAASEGERRSCCSAAASWCWLELCGAAFSICNPPAHRQR